MNAWDTARGHNALDAIIKIARELGRIADALEEQNKKEGD